MNQPNLKLVIEIGSLNKFKSETILKMGRKELRLTIVSFLCAFLEATFPGLKKVNFNFINFNKCLNILSTYFGSWKKSKFC